MISKLIYYKDEQKVEIYMNKIILSTKTPGNMLSLKNGSDDAGILIDIWGFILIGQSIDLPLSNASKMCMKASFYVLKLNRILQIILHKGKDKAWEIAERSLPPPHSYFILLFFLYTTLLCLHCFPSPSHTLNSFE